ncbi:MAG: T9SS type A sorting domain-containing protein [Calditrichaeota bacterium]|nr:T9SS type A sorting domain-containing protein [Calditrichota bacterium]HQU71145.1 FlgD immunoglobulin-like domain containing protein [Calditrichia bacterium]
MTNRETKYWLFYLILAGMICFPMMAQDQQEDEREFDNVHDLIIRGEVSAPGTPPGMRLEVSTDEAGFDNFFLGTDFSEPHLSTNPLAPTEYFNAWNTNDTHYTYDGFSWFSASPNFGFPMAGDPVTAYDSLGNLYYMNMFTSGGSIIGCKVIVSQDNGATWSSALTSIDGRDKNWIAADQTMGPYANYVYCTMTGASSPVGNFSRSTDQGATWQTTFSPTTQTLPGMMVCVGPDVLNGNNVSGGAVYVVTNSGSSFSSLYTFYVSNDGGATFTRQGGFNFANYVGTDVNGRNSVSNMRTRPYPFITADNSFGPNRGRLYLMYASNFPAGNGNNPDIFLRYSDTQGQMWSDPIVVNDDPNSEANAQFKPAVWCDKETGRIYAKWYDTRNCPTTDSMDVYASYSDDGGLTWAANTRITPSVFRIDCTSCGGGGTPRYQGDYDAITSNDVTSMMVWADFRVGRFDSYAAYFPDFAMLTDVAADTLERQDSLDVTVSIPDVKMYDNNVYFSVEEGSGANFTFEFPDGDSLTTLPGAVRVRIFSNDVSNGNYLISIVAKGPNGTPAHQRLVDLLVTGPAVAVNQPNGGESLLSQTLYPIRWDAVFVDSVLLSYSPDNGATWVPITDSPIAGKIHDSRPPKRRALDGDTPQNPEVVSQYDWVVPTEASSNYLVRVESAIDNTVLDVSDATFSVENGPAPRWRVQGGAPDSLDLYSISMLDSANAWAAGANGLVLRTTNGGNSWAPTLRSASADIYAIEGLSSTRALVATYDGSKARLERTFNGGISWAVVYEDTLAGAFLNGIHMFNSTDGYAVGDPVNGEWTLLRTDNTGQSWIPVTGVAAGNEFGWNNSLAFVNDLVGIFGTDNSSVMLTQDGGLSWTAVSVPFQNVYNVAMSADTLAVAVGEGVALSGDGGQNWNQTAGNPASTSVGAGISEYGTGRYYVISGNDVYRTDDNGATFAVDFTQSNTLNDMELRYANINGNDWIVGFAVGNGGRIVKYSELITVTGIEPTAGVVPDNYRLSQNYPNPFNPTTRIAFSIPEAADIQLEVLNLLGQRVRTLVDQHQNPGSFEATWDGRNEAGMPVASGVYLYRLTANGQSGKHFSETRKMLFLK